MPALMTNPEPRQTNRRMSESFQKLLGEGAAALTETSSTWPSLAQRPTAGIAPMLAANIIVLPCVLTLVDAGTPGASKGSS